MAAATQIPLSEYLESSYRPDREYVDGELRKRNVGNWDHARVQALLAAWFVNHEGQWGAMAETERRMLIPKSATRFDVRTPDLVVVLAGASVTAKLSLSQHVHGHTRAGSKTYRNLIRKRYYLKISSQLPARR